MSKKILFSPVGGTDPISQTNGFEGALMQIARYWRPDILCLYMSKEILERQKQDGGEGRYLYCLHKLEEEVGSCFDIRIISREELEEVQLFDPIYMDFEKILGSIEERMDETDELLLNISSGTPAMKSALLVLATFLDYRCKCIQVDTPDKKMNEHIHKGDWKLEDFWDCDFDNEPEGKDRTHWEELPSLKLLKYEEIIKNFVNEYDYSAALKLAENIKGEQVRPYISKLDLAVARIELNNSKVNALIKDEDKNIYLPYESGDYRTLYEYILNLQVKVDRNEYADFLRGLSPVFVNIFALILKTNTGFNLRDYSFEAKDGGLMWNSKKLKNTEYESILNRAYSAPFKGNYVLADHLSKLIEKLIEDQGIKKCVSDLRDVEKKARNIAAHNIVHVDDSWIKEKTGYRSKEIIDKIHKACGYTSMNTGCCDWNSYQKMNEDIASTISANR